MVHVLQPIRSAWHSKNGPRGTERAVRVAPFPTLRSGSRDSGATPASS